MIWIFAWTILISETPEEAARAMKSIWSPYCKGISLLECPSTKAEVLRNEVYERVRKGESFSTIYADLQNRYGQDVLRMAPEGVGREGLSYLIPWILFAAAALFVAFYWSRRPRKRVAAPRNTPSVDRIMAERIERDLKERLDS